MTPEFLRRYYVMRIITSPKVYQLTEGNVTLDQLQAALNTIKSRNCDDVLYEKLELHSRKTINRDLQKIESYYNIIIRHKRNYGFYVEDQDYKDMDMLKEVYEKTELYLLNHHAHSWNDYVSSARTSLSEHIDMVALINAIDQQFIVDLEYKGWYDDNKFQTFKGRIQPLHIKEINNAWYLIAFNDRIGVNAFCLDRRIRNLTISTEKSKDRVNFDVEDYFKHAIGILKTEMAPEWIHLKVANHHLKYLQANKMHPTQEVVALPKRPETDTLDYEDSKMWGEIKIYVEPNYEFLMEILKYNLWVKVTKPNHVKDFVKQHLQLMMSYYN